MESNWQEEKVLVNGVTVELRKGGEGPPLVILHGEEIRRELAPFHSLLAERFQVLVPSLPGLGRTELPGWIDCVDDLAHFSLDLIDGLNRGGVHLLGIGFGGWVATEMAVISRQELNKLILVDSVGIKVSEPWVRDIADIFVLSSNELARLAWHDPAKANQMNVPGTPGMSEEDLLESLRNRQTVLSLGWKPFMHNPKLMGRLRRVKIPTLVVWGENDRAVSPDYGRAFHDAIPNSKFRLIPLAGHYPHREQPEEFVRVVTEFLL